MEEDFCRPDESYAERIQILQEVSRAGAVSSLFDFIVADASRLYTGVDEGALRPSELDYSQLITSY